MISSIRVKKAEDEGFYAYLNTGGGAERTEARYHLHSAENRGFSRGWNKGKRLMKKYKYRFRIPVWEL